jgi:hypothetical protein
MKRLPVWLISLALLCGMLVACGGDHHESHDHGRPLGVAGVMEGIWNGRLHSNVTGRDTGMFVIVTASGMFDLLTSDCGQISASIAANGPFFSGAGTSYTQTNCDGIDVTVVPPSPNVGPTESFQISGQFDDQTGTALANYSTTNDSGTISFINFYPDYFREQGVVSRAVGSYSVRQRLTALSVDANGNVVYRDASGRTFPGTLIVMDPEVDVYRMTLQVGGQPLTGLATLVDDGDGRDNDFVFAIASGEVAYNAELARD